LKSPAARLFAPRSLPTRWAIVIGSHFRLEQAASIFHNPDTIRLAVTTFHRLDNFFHRCRIVPIARKYLIPQRHSALAYNKPDANLPAVRAMVSAITPLCKKIAVRLTLEIRAGYIV
jgi:hypothetical protein